MKLLFLFSWRNLWRNPKRTLLTVTAVSFATAVLMFFMGIQFKAYETAVDATTSLFHGHAQIQPPGFANKPQMRLILRDPKSIEETLVQNGRISAWAPRDYAFVLASSGERTYGVQLLGVDPDRERLVSSVLSSIRTGQAIRKDDDSGAVIGSSLAKNLKVGVGDEITVLGQAHDGSLATAAFLVRGIFETGSSDLDRNMMEIPIGVFDPLFAMNGAVHTFAFRVKNFDSLPEVQLALSLAIAAKNVSDFRILRWDEILPGLKQSIQLDMSAGWLFFTALIVIVFFSVLNTFLMAVLERSKEFAVITALGMKPARLRRLIMTESILLGLVGASAGLGLGSIVVSIMHIYGFSIPGTEEVRKMWNLPGTIYPDLGLLVALIGPIVLFITCAVSGIYPAFKAARRPVIEGIRGI